MSSVLANGSVETSLAQPVAAADDDQSNALLTQKEEMQYQRALWVNRLLKEQLARETQGLTIKEIEEAQASIQARIRETRRVEAIRAPDSSRRVVAASPRVVNYMGQAPGNRGAAVPLHTAHSATQRRKRDVQIRDENAAFLKRLESVRSSFSPRMSNPSTQIPRLSPCSRLLER
mmetsp:Transcript_16005/g.37739  ORF Transcript_16005/g.37739 Transcript_16005/m.37739 type:complete len:175 (-) Transcript_16005:98-622(-)